MRNQLGLAHSVRYAKSLHIKLPIPVVQNVDQTAQAHQGVQWRGGEIWHPE